MIALDRLSGVVLLRSLALAVAWAILMKMERSYVISLRKYVPGRSVDSHVAGTGDRGTANQQGHCIRTPDGRSWLAASLNCETIEPKGRRDRPGQTGQTRVFRVALGSGGCGESRDTHIPSTQSQGGRGGRHGFYLRKHLLVGCTVARMHACAL